ncbi:MAG: hypothetical protein GWO85_01075 [Simkaniaceae bacterium]|nr:hypothetical protein [Simkaniaceae bacterium]
MDIEKKLESVFASNIEINPDEIIDRFHSQRVIRNRQKQRLLNGAAAAMIILFVGVFSINLFNGHSSIILTENPPASIEDTFTDEMVDEFAYYLMDESEDIWETLEFLNEIGYEPVTNLINGGS